MTTASVYRIAVRRVPTSGGASLSRLARPLATLLLAAFVAALAVVADRWVDSWSDDHLFAAWVLIWAVVFAATVLACGPASRLAQIILMALSDWAGARRQARTEAMLRDLLHDDERLMADISLAPDRADLRATSQATPSYDADAARGANIDEEISASKLRLRRAQALM